MTIISSQRFRDWNIIMEKMEELEASGVTFVSIPVVNAFLDDMFIVVDHHHLMTAARELGIEIRFEEVDDEMSYYKDIEDHNTDGILEAHRMDAAYYYVDADCEEMIGADVF